MELGIKLRLSDLKVPAFKISSSLGSRKSRRTEQWPQWSETRRKHDPKVQFVPFVGLLCFYQDSKVTRLQISGVEPVRKVLRETVAACL